MVFEFLDNFFFNFENELTLQVSEKLPYFVFKKPHKDYGLLTKEEKNQPHNFFHFTYSFLDTKHILHKERLDFFKNNAYIFVWP